VTVEFEVDVCIVGGGPAGAVLGLRLASLGHTVVIVERSMHAEKAEHARCETLHAGAWPILDHLGITRDVLATGALPIHRSLVRWSDDAAFARDHPMPQLAVLRPRLDAALLGLARRAGALVQQPAVATRATLEDDAWQIAIEHPGGVTNVRARLVGDASGRASWRRGARAQTSARTFAMRGLWSNPALPPELRNEARIEALEDGWLWGAPAAPGRYAVMAMVDADLPGTPLGPERYLRCLGASQLFCEVASHATLVTGVDICDATGHAPSAACEDRLFRLGDAGYSLDPLSSAGLHTALGSALHASAAMHTQLLHPDRELLVRRFYEDARRTEIARHRAWAAELYAECRWRSHAFWQRRAAAPAAPVPARDVAAAPDPASTHVALSAGVALEEMPCIAGDVIEARLGVTSRAHDRPFVWVAGIAIAPLVAPLVMRPMPPAELVATWSHVPPARHRELFSWLLRECIVCPVAHRDP